MTLYGNFWQTKGPVSRIAIQPGSSARAQGRTSPEAKLPDLITSHISSPCHIYLKSVLEKASSSLQASCLFPVLRIRVLACPSFACDTRASRHETNHSLIAQKRRSTTHEPDFLHLMSTKSRARDLQTRMSEEVTSGCKCSKIIGDTVHSCKSSLS